MKNKKWNLILSLALLTGLTACQQQASDPVIAEFQQKASQALGTYARRLSAGYATAQKNQAQGNGLRGFGSWDPWGGQPYGGQVMAGSIEQNIQNCTAMVGGIPAAPQNYYFMVASLGRCLDMVVSYRNPIYTMANRNMDPNSQYYWSYALNYSRPGTFGSFNGQDYAAWNSYASWGHFTPLGN